MTHIERVERWHFATGREVFSFTLAIEHHRTVLSQRRVHGKIVEALRERYAAEDARFFERIGDLHASGAESRVVSLSPREIEIAKAALKGYGSNPSIGRMIEYDADVYALREKFVS